MTLKGWLALLAIYVGYLFLGAFLFNAIECPRELAELEKLEKEDLHLTTKIRSMWKGLEEQNQKVCAFFVPTASYDFKDLEEILGHWQHRGFVMRDSIEGNKSALEPDVRLISWNCFYHSFNICKGLHSVESTQLPLFLLHSGDNNWIWSPGGQFVLDLDKFHPQRCLRHRQRRWVG